MKPSIVFVLATKASAFGYYHRSAGSTDLSRDSATKAPRQASDAFGLQATRSITFKPFERNWQSFSNRSTLRDSEWTWNVNVSESALSSVPDMVDPHVVLSSYGFTWPGGGNISMAADNATGTACLSMIRTVDFPVNITNRFTDENANSTDCAPVLGKACRDAIIDTLPHDDGCTLRQNWSEIPECKDSLGYAATTHQDLKPLTLPVALNESNQSWFNWTSGRKFAVLQGALSNGSNPWAFQEASNQLQILMITLPLPDLDDPSITYQSDLHCMRVNATKLPESADLNGDGFTLTSEAIKGSPSSSAASSQLIPSLVIAGWMTAMAALWTLQ